jgi:hypothetical protein
MLELAGAREVGRLYGYGRLDVFGFSRVGDADADEVRAVFLPLVWKDNI